MLPERRILLTSDRAVRIFDPNTGLSNVVVRHRASQAGREDCEQAVSPDGKLFASCVEFDDLARVWDLTTGREICHIGMASLPKSDRVPDFVTGRARHCVWFSADSKELLTWHEGVVRAWNPRTGEQRRTLNIPNMVFAVSPDRCVLAARNDPGFKEPLPRKIRLYDSVTGRELRQFECPESNNDWWFGVGFSPDSKQVAFIGGQMDCYVATVTGKEKPRVFQFPSFNPDSVSPLGWWRVAFPSDGRSLFGISFEETLGRFDLESGKQLALWAMSEPGLTGLLLTPDGKQLIFVDGTIRRWDVAKEEQLPLPDGYSARLIAVRSPNGKSVVMGDWTGRLDLWDATNGRRIQTWRTAGPGIRAIDFSPDNSLCAIVGGSRGVILIEVATGRETQTIPRPEGHGRWYCHGVLFTPDNKRFLTWNFDDEHYLRMFDLTTQKELWSKLIVNANGMAISPDGQTVVAKGYKTVLTFLDAATGNMRFYAAPEPRPPSKLDRLDIGDPIFMPDSRTVVAAITSRKAASIRFWDVDAGKETKAIDIPVAVGVERMAVSPDGKWLLTFGSDYVLRLWEIATAAEVRKLGELEGPVGGISFGPDGRTAFTSGWADALLWDLRPLGSPVAVPVFASLWDDLAAAPPTAHAAQWALIEDSKAAIGLLRAKLSKEEDDPKRVARWLKDLDSDIFKVRETADRALAKLGPTEAPILRKAMAETKSAEVRQRLEHLVPGLRNDKSPEELRRIRAVQTVELIGTVESVALLREWSERAAGAQLTEDARAALQRLKRFRADK
jgi:WD40 repeat protein